MHSKHIKHLVTILLLISALLAAIGSLGDPFFDLLAAAPAVLFVACVVALLLVFDGLWDFVAHCVSIKLKRPGGLQNIINIYKDRCPHCEDVAANIWATLVATGILHAVYGHGISWFALFAFALTAGAATLRLALYDHCCLICERIVAGYEKQISQAVIPSKHPEHFPN